MVMMHHMVMMLGGATWCYCASARHQLDPH